MCVLARKSFLIFLTEALSGVLGIAALFFVGRYFEPGPYGMVWFALGLLGLLSALTKLGFEKAHIKRISEGKDLATCMGTFTRIKLVIIALFTILALVIVVGRELTVGFVAASTFPVILVLIGYKILFKLRSIPKQSFNALRLTASTQTVVFLENASRLPLIIVVTLAFAFSRGRSVPLEGLWTSITQRFGGLPPMSEELGAVLLAGAYTIAMFLSFIAAVWLLRHHRIPIGKFDRDLAKTYWIFAWPIAGYAVLKTMTYHIDSVMIGYFWTGSEVGFYRAAQQFVTIVLVIPTAVRTLFFPMISQLISKREWADVHDLAVSTQRLMSLVMVPILMLTVVYAGDVFRIVMSLTWVPAAPALRLLVLHATLSVFTTVTASSLMGIDRVKTVMAVSLIGVFLNIAMNVVFIPSSLLGVPLFGLQMTGAALASALSKAVMVTVLFFVGKRILGKAYFSRSILIHVLAALLTGSVLWAAEHYVDGIAVVRIWELALASVAGVALYAALLFIMRELREDDYRFFLNLIDPGRMGRYVRGELKGRR